jgi:hypothetical protein
VVGDLVQTLSGGISAGIPIIDITAKWDTGIFGKPVVGPFNGAAVGYP